MTNPIPVPSMSVFSASRRLNDSKSLVMFFSLMPVPVSVMDILYKLLFYKLTLILTCPLRR
ncbi:MAG: hypothetical protein OEY65_07150, partial [Gammaproteobacteria bacterium]|nr:hypothetical protein [Gammaproteobacteria bacterium]